MVFGKKMKLFQNYGVLHDFFSENVVSEDVVFFTSCSETRSKHTTFSEQKIKNTTILENTTFIEKKSKNTTFLEFALD